MDETHYNENESNWQIPNDEYEGGNEEETLASPSEYQKFFDCNSDKCEKQRKPRQHKIKTNMETLIRNMDNPNNFRETLSEITTITHNILNSLKLCIDNRNSKSTENERSKYSCGYNSATYHSGEKHLQRITTLADKFLKTFDEPCKESMDQIFLTCKPYNESKRNNCEKYQNGDSSELKDFPLVIPFKPFELIVPVKIGKGSVIKTFQHQQDWTESSIEDAHTFIPNLMYHKVSESSSDIFFSLKDTSYFSCEDSEPLIERFPIWGTFSHKEFCTNATQTQCPFLPKLADATKSKSTGFLRTPESVSLCLICSKPINCCICVKPSFTKIHIGNIDRANHAPSELLDETYQTRPITLSKKIQTMMPDVNVDFQVTYGAAPSYILTCKKCGKAECVCDSSAAVASTTLIHPAKSILCSKCGIENCTCNTAQISSQKCNKCLKPIEKCICEKPQTSKTYKSNLPEVHTNYCQRCAKALDRCICEKPQPSKYIESSNIMVGSSLHSCTCDKPLGEKCTICGSDLNKCICTEAHGSEAVTSQSKLPSKSSSKKLKTVTVPTVCQCGLRQEKCKCTKSSPTDVCGKCGLAIKKCICPEKLPRIYCLKCQRTIDKCICKTISQATDTPRTCETCGNFIEKCVCSKLKPQEATLCNRCGELLHKCVCKKTQAIQTEVFEGICSKCGEPFFKCACRTDEGVQTINEEICERCGNEVSVCSCSRTEATQTDPPKYKRILCDKWQYKVYVKEDEEPIPCTCDMEHVHSEEKLTDLLKIPESDLEDDIVKCICDLKEAADLPVFVEKMIQEEAVFVEETLESEEEVVEEELPEEEVIEKSPLIAPEPPPKPPRKVYRLAFPQHKDLEICKKCRFEPSPLIDQDGRVFCPGNCGCCLCPWKPHLSPSQEDVLKHRKFKVCKCRKRGTVFTKFAATDSDCSQVSYFDECPCRDLAEAKHFQLYGFDMWDLNEKLLQKFRGEQVYLRDVREITPTKIPSTKFLSRAQNDDTQSDINRSHENLDANLNIDESQQPAQQKQSKPLHTSKLCCDCKKIILEIDPDSTYDPCKRQECSSHPNDKQEKTPTTKTEKSPPSIRPLYPSKFTRKVPTTQEFSSSSSHPSSTREKSPLDKDISTSDSCFEAYPVHLRVRMEQPNLKSQSQTEQPNINCLAIQRNVGLDFTDSEDYYSCESDTSEEESYNETLEPSNTTEISICNQTTARNLYILKLLQEIVNLIQDGSNIKEEAIRIVNTCPLFKTASEIKPCLEISNIYAPELQLQNPSYVCIAVDQEEPIFFDLNDESFHNNYKLSYKSLPPAPISEIGLDSESLVCICPKKTDVCPKHGPISSNIESEGEIKVYVPEDTTEQSARFNRRVIHDYECECEECECEEEIQEEILGNTDMEYKCFMEEDTPIICICPKEGDICPLHQIQIKLVKDSSHAKVQEPYDPCANFNEFKMCILPEDELEQPPIWGSKLPLKDVYDPCANALDYNMYELPEELVAQQPPIWGSKNHVEEEEEDIFPDLSCECSDDFLDEKEEGESKLFSEEEEVKVEPKEINEEEKEEAESKEVIEENKEEETVGVEETTPERIAEDLGVFSYEELYEVECEEFDEECELLKEIMAEHRKRRDVKDLEEEKCNCCHCQAMRSGKCKCTALATMEEPLAHIDDEMKFFIDSLVLDLEAMRYARRKHQAQLNMSNPKPPTCSRDSFPVTITNVIELGNTSLYVKWKIHDNCGIAGYEIYVDGYLTNRYYSSRHEASVITNVDITVPHKIALVAQPHNYDESLAALCAEFTGTTKLKPKPLPWKTGSHKEKAAHLPQVSHPPALWIPSIYMYDPSDCQESTPFRKPIL